jgi:hypothetical protein
MPENLRATSVKTAEEQFSQTVPEDGSSRSQKLWGGLLVLDAIFVIIFGGALAAKVFQYWQSPAPGAVILRRSKVQPSGPKKPGAPKTAQDPAPAKPPELLKPTDRAIEGGSTASDQTPQTTELAAQAQAGKPSQAKGPAPEEGPKTGPVQARKGKTTQVKFHLKAPTAKSVALAGPFLKRGRKAMARNGEGIWTLTIYLTPNAYRYHFLVNGKKTLDPENTQTERGASLLKVE